MLMAKAKSHDLLPIEVGCRLNYKITKPTVLLLNIVCAETEHQEIISEKLVISPNVEAVPCRIGIAKNRFTD